jgi:hypothetical protein
MKFTSSRMRRTWCPIDMAAVLADMVTFNGGRRLTCLA